jgi:probable F420-dependent oxidoreductase
VDLTGTGIWAFQLRYGDAAQSRDAVAELEELGYSAVWIPDVGGPLFEAVENLLTGSTAMVVATGVLNLWMHDAAEAGRQHARLTSAYGDRFLVGIGVSHSALIDRDEPGRYARPVARTRDYLDALDAATPTVPVDARVLAALGPRMLGLAAERSRGAHTYLVTPDHTATAREALGPGKLIAAEQGVVLESDPAVARGLARGALAGYLGLPNYANNWRRLGFTDDDIADGGSDRLVDALFAWGDEEAIARRVREHRDAGADHVCLQVVTADASTPLEQWRRLAPALR